MESREAQIIYLSQASSQGWGMVAFLFALHNN